MSGAVPVPASERLKILIIAPIRFPLREPFAGGLEAQTWALTHILTERGHSVEVAGADHSDARMVTHSIGALPASGAERADIAESSALVGAEHAAFAALMADLADGLLGSFDIVHNNSLHPLPVQQAHTLPAPMVIGLHTPPLPWAASYLAAGRRPTGEFVAVSAATAASWAPLVDATVVRNGVDTSAWTPGPGGDGAVWSGRIVPEKAPHLAIELARAAGLPLILAGPIIDREYFRSEIAPRLGPQVRYAGHLTQAELAGLVGGSAVALVTPVWDEPFGMVAVEAMACGTPVVAFARGGLPEIVDKETGRLLLPTDSSGRVSDLTAAVAQIEAAMALSRPEIRRHAESRWSLDAMAGGYEQVYLDALRPGRF